MAAKVRRQYAGAAAQTSITSSITSGDTSVSIASTTGWPSTASVPFYVVIDPDTSVEEKCSVTISGSTLTLTRGVDGTVAAAHSSGATIYPVFTAVDADEANELASKFTAKGDIVTQGASTFTTTTVGADGTFLKASSAAAGGVAWDTVDLGTDTSGNYVATITGTANQVSVSGSGSETAAVTLSTPQDIHTGATPTFAGGVFSGSSSGDLLRITQTGTGNALLVEDSTNPDATPFVIATDGRVLAGIDTPRVNFFNAVAGSETTKVEVEGTNFATSSLSLVRNSSTGAAGPVMILAKSNGTTVASNTAVASGSLMGLISFQGNDGTNMIESGAIQSLVDGTVSTGVVPGRLIFQTASSTGTLTERMRIDSAGLTTITGTAVITSNASSDALRITQTGTGNALVVEDSTNPDSTPTIIDATGRVVVGATTAATTRIGATTITAPFQILGTTNATASSLFGRYSNDVTAPNIFLAKSRDTSIGSFTTVAAADQLGVISFAGADGTQMVEAARITVLAEGTVSTGVVPGLLTFNTASSAGTLTERMRIDSAGQVGIGTTTVAGRTLTVGKTLTGGTTAFGIVMNGVAQSDVTVAAQGVRSAIGTAAASFTLPVAYHFFAAQGTFGAGSTVTTQAGYTVDSGMTGATNNFGFYGTLAAATGRWNLYMEGTAANYLAGRLGVGATLTSGAMAQITNTTAADVAFIVKGAASQSGDLENWQNSAGTVLMRVTSGGNLGVNTNSFGTGTGVVAIANAGTVPSTNPTAGGVLYVESGALKYRGSSGTITTIANA